MADWTLSLVPSPRCSGTRRPCYVTCRIGIGSGKAVKAYGQASGGKAPVPLLLTRRPSRLNPSTLSRHAPPRQCRSVSNVAGHQITADPRRRRATVSICGRFGSSRKRQAAAPPPLVVVAPSRLALSPRVSKVSTSSYVAEGERAVPELLSGCGAGIVERHVACRGGVDGRVLAHGERQRNLLASLEIPTRGRLDHRRDRRCRGGVDDDAGKSLRQVRGLSALPARLAMVPLTAVTCSAGVF